VSEENVEIIRRAVDAFNAEGPDAAGDRFFADEVEFHDPPDSPSPRVARGREQVRAQFNAFNEAWESRRSEPQEVRAVGADRVLLVSTEHFRGRDGIEVQATSASVFTLRDGKVVRWQAFWDRARALEALGISEGG
jgi:ketosteroid isomerase-like protein